jgi:hypothetical protein
MRKFLPTIALIAFAVVFVFGIIQLFELRFEAGDVYQPYSSLRSDPLGTRALYESMEKLPGVTAQRDFSSDDHLPEDASTTYLHLAGSQYEWDWLPQDTFHEIEGFVKRGGRLVITLFPEASDHYQHYPRDEDSDTNAEPKVKKDSKDSKDDQAAKEIKDKKDSEKNDAKKTDVKKSKKKKFSDDETAEIQKVSLEEKWGLGFSVTNLSMGDDDAYAPVQVRNQTTLPLPHTLEWHSGIILTNLDKAWQAIYSRGTNPVVAERKFGRGTVVIATDSYFVSNEALLKDRHADFLAWLVGSSKTVIFDEAHLGTVETSGVSALLRKYRLYWFIAALIILAVLFIWKNSLSLAPRYAEQKQEEYIAGKEAASGFVNLLRRNIPVGKLLETCFAEWKKSAANSGKYSRVRLQQAEAIFEAEKSVAASGPNALAAYQHISTALNNRKIEPGNSNPGNATNS